MRTAKIANCALLSLATLAMLILLAPGVAWADILDTVDWAADSTLDGTGTGTLAAGTITVNYSTIVGVGNAGITIGDNWAVSLATDGVAGGGVTHPTGGVFGTTATASPFTQTVTFSSNVTDLLLLVNFGDATSSMDFGSHSLTLLDSVNASLSGSVVTFPGATNSFHDGFAASIAGIFGPSNPLIFTYTTSVPFESVGFTVSARSVPEPGSFALLGIGAAGLAGYGLRRWRKIPA